MTENPNNEVAEQVLCDGCVSVPLSVLALETEEPINGWQTLLDALNIKVVTDYIGRKAIVAVAARRLLSEVARRERFAAETAAANFERMSASIQVKPGGLPVVEGATPYQSMVAAEGGIVTPSAEFGDGREKPTFLQDELLAGERHLEEKRRLAAERAKERLADQMRDKLGGKR